ncbi:hypothetical protein UFOVP256_50 [uncultured Caudovirales phage]|uniref:Uncharacterized protein n=1 Tax=uncultured Caudovirales phage TaxID=2100421 RepID=A0A6J5LLH2_9CAUD|nr:hypothetical protein UFOVP256_50 [uncultured Caudovirales phage]
MENRPYELDTKSIINLLESVERRLISIQSVLEYGNKYVQKQKDLEKEREQQKAKEYYV